MPLKFTRDNKVYKGFNSLHHTREIPNDSLVVIVWFDGEAELWIAEDGPEGLSELRRMYRDEWGDRHMPFNVLKPISSGLV